MQEKESLKKKGNNYFDEHTEKAIVDFQKETDIQLKKKIFVERIAPSFNKLIENIVYVYKFHTLGNLDTLRNDCLSFLFEVLHKFNPDKGHRAFSYLSVVTRNWFIQKAKVNKKRNKVDVNFDKECLKSLEKNAEEIILPSHENILIDREFLLLLKEDIQGWRKRFQKPQERKVLEAVILLIENPDSINIFNKKAIYLYIREITQLNTKQIVTNLTKLRKKYEQFKKKYENGEI